jgi:hypothetical protein
MRRSRAPSNPERENHNDAGGRLRRDRVLYCNAIAWGKVGAVVAALALTYGVAMSIALVVYVYRF